MIFFYRRYIDLFNGADLFFFYNIHAARNDPTIVTNNTKMPGTIKNL